jgi:hypothetical protein
MSGHRNKRAAGTASGVFAMLSALLVLFAAVVALAATQRSITDPSVSHQA